MGKPRIKRWNQSLCRRKWSEFITNKNTARERAKHGSHKYTIQIQLACVRKRTNPQLFLTLGKQGHALQSNNKRGRERARRKNTATGARPTRQQQKGEKGQGERTQQQGHAQQGNNKEGERGLMYGMCSNELLGAAEEFAELGNHP
jgi:hypothetical protein